MEYRKLDVGTKLRYVGNQSHYGDGDGELRVGDTLVLEHDDGTGCPYKARCERINDYYWFYAADVELLDATPTVALRKTITLTTDDGVEFTYDGSGVLIAHSETGAVTVALATLIAAVDELRKEAK